MGLTVETLWPAVRRSSTNTPYLISVSMNAACEQSSGDSTGSYGWMDEKSLSWSQTNRKHVRGPDHRSERLSTPYHFQ